MTKPTKTSTPPVNPWASRFAQLNVPGPNIIQQVKAVVKVVPYTAAQVKRYEAAATAAAKKDKYSTLLTMQGKRNIGGAAVLVRGHFYNLDLDFADGPLRTGMPLSAVYPPFDPDPNKNRAAYLQWGKSFANPLVDPRAGYRYMVRLRIEQLRPEPNIRGFALQWQLPDESTDGHRPFEWDDGGGDVTKHVVTSNPLFIIRIARTSSDRALVAYASNLGGFNVAVMKFWE